MPAICSASSADGIASVSRMPPRTLSLSNGTARRVQGPQRRETLTGSSLSSSRTYWALTQPLTVVCEVRLVFDKQPGFFRRQGQEN